MKELSREQELALLRSLSSDDKIDNGGGRVVFELDSAIARKLELCEYKDYIVKIALGDKGLNQNELEIATYLRYKDEVSLAEIPVIGRISLIMEKVDTEFADCITDVCGDYYCDDLSDLDSGCDEEIDLDAIDEQQEYLVRYLVRDYGYDRDCAEADAECIVAIYNELTDIHGNTADNGQIGRNADGDWVAYDYGFDPDLGCSNQCSATRDYIYNEDWCDLFLNTLIENIYNEPDLWNYSPHGLMKAVEDEFLEYMENERNSRHEDEDEEECGGLCMTMKSVAWYDRYFDDPRIRPAHSIARHVSYRQSLPVYEQQKTWYNLKNCLDNYENKVYTVYLT